MSQLANNTTMAIRIDETTLPSLLEKINSLPDAGSGGVELPELTSPATSADILLGKEAINAEGNKITGNFSIDEELTAQDSLISQIQTALEGKASGGEVSCVLQDKTATPSTSSQVITADDGYDGLNTVTIEAIPSTFIEPTGTISITTSGRHNVREYEFASVIIEGGNSSIPTVGSYGFMTSTAAGSVIYSIASGESISYTQTTLVYQQGPNKYRHSISETLLPNTPIIVLTTGTVTMPILGDYSPFPIASGTGYHMYIYSSEK